MDHLGGDQLALGRASDLFFTARATAMQSPHTGAAYASDIRIVGALLARNLGYPRWEAVPLGDVDTTALREAFQAFVAGHGRKIARDKKTPPPRSPATVSRAWTAWDQMYGQLVLDGHLAGNPMAAVRRPKVPKGAPKALRGTDTVERLVEAVEGEGAVRTARRRSWPERDYAIVIVLLTTGLRMSEMLSLRVDAVDGGAYERRITVVGKGDKTRTISIDESLVAVLDVYLASRRRRFGAAKPSDPLWVNHHGEGLGRGALQYMIHRAYREAGITGRVPTGALVHALRHTCATRMAETGATATEIARVLGHSSIATSQVYIDTTGRELREATLANPVYELVRRKARRLDQETSQANALP
jgi:site-specific recombinase XerD